MPEALNVEVPQTARLLRATIMLYKDPKELPADEHHALIEREQAALAPEERNSCQGCPHNEWGSTCCGKCGYHMLGRVLNVTREEYEALKNAKAAANHLEARAAVIGVEAQAAKDALRSAIDSGADSDTVDALMETAVELGTRHKHAREKAAAARLAFSAFKEVA